MPGSGNTVVVLAHSNANAMGSIKVLDQGGDEQTCSLLRRLLAQRQRQGGTQVAVEGVLPAGGLLGSELLSTRHASRHRRCGLCNGSGMQSGTFGRAKAMRLAWQPHGCAQAAMGRDG